jgi:hypothetical protein
MMTLPQAQITPARISDSFSASTARELRKQIEWPCQFPPGHREGIRSDEKVTALENATGREVAHIQPVVAELLKDLLIKCGDVTRKLIRGTTNGLLAALDDNGLTVSAAVRTAFQNTNYNPDFVVFAQDTQLDKAYVWLTVF